MRACYAALDMGRESFVLALGQSGSSGLLFSGVKEGTVPNQSRAGFPDQEAQVSALASLLREVRSQERLSPLFLCLPGQYLHWEKREASLELSRKPVSWKEIEALQKSIRDFPSDKNRQLLHCLPLQYSLDDTLVTDDPLGKRGERLSLSAYVATVDQHLLDEYLECVQQAGGEVEAVIARPLAEGECLTPEDKEKGVAVLNVGDGETCFSLFYQGNFYKSFTVPLGCRHIVNDLAYGLKISLEEACKLKKQATLLENVLPHLLPGESAKEKQMESFIREIVEARVEEIFSFVARNVAEQGLSAMFSKGLILIGEGAGIKGIEKVAQRFFEVPVRIGRGEERVRGLALVRSPAHIPAVGALFYAYYHYPYALSFFSKCAKVGKAILARMAHFF